MWKKWINKLKPAMDVSKKKEHIQVRATKDGKLYVKVADLFKQRNVQELIQKMSESEVFKAR